jgi:hypothetical protein
MIPRYTSRSSGCNPSPPDSGEFGDIEFLYRLPRIPSFGATTSDYAEILNHHEQKGTSEELEILSGFVEAHFDGKRSRGSKTFELIHGMTLPFLKASGEEVQDWWWKGTLTVTWDIGGAEDGRLVIDGCSDVAVGVTEIVTAKGEPAGGRYSFKSNPPDMIKIDAKAGRAHVTGSKPGQGTIEVEYTAPGGGTGHKSQRASVIRLESVNGGESIPEIGLFDADGKRTKAIRSVPLATSPSDASELLIFKPGNPGVLSVVNQGTELLLQGVREGKTTVQPQTKCGKPTGRVFSVEVVPCEAEVLRTLAEQERIVKEGIDNLTQEHTKATSNDKFNKASEDISKSTLDLLIKTGGLIIGPLGGAGGTAVKTASDIYGHFSNIRDIFNAQTSEEMRFAMLQEAAQVADAAVIGTIMGALDAMEAATKFGGDLGELIKTSMVIENLDPMLDHWRKTLEDVRRRQRICRVGTGQPAPQLEPKPQDTGKKPSGKKTPNKPTAEPKQGPPGEQPPQADPPTPAQEPDDPEPPTPKEPGRLIALPYSESECGCERKQMIQAGNGGMESLTNGLRNLQACAEEFRTDGLDAYHGTLTDLRTITRELAVAGSVAAAERPGRKGDWLGRMTPLMDEVEAFDKRGREFHEKMKPCPSELESSVGVVRSK